MMPHIRTTDLLAPPVGRFTAEAFLCGITEKSPKPLHRWDARVDIDCTLDSSGTARLKNRSGVALLFVRKDIPAGAALRLAVVCATSEGCPKTALPAMICMV